MILFATTIPNGNDDLYVEKIHYSFIRFIWLLVNDSVRTHEQSIYRCLIGIRISTRIVRDYSTFSIELTKTHRAGAHTVKVSNVTPVSRVKPV